jgi:hypothetical protein
MELWVRRFSKTMGKCVVCCYQKSRISRSLPSRAAPISQDPPDQLRSNKLFAVLTGVSPEIYVYTLHLIHLHTYSVSNAFLLLLQTETPFSIWCLAL